MTRESTVDLSDFVKRVAAVIEPRSKTDKNKVHQTGVNAEKAVLNLLAIGELKAVVAISIERAADFVSPVVLALPPPDTVGDEEDERESWLLNDDDDLDEEETAGAGTQATNHSQDILALLRQLRAQRSGDRVTGLFEISTTFWAGARLPLGKLFPRHIDPALLSRPSLDGTSNEQVLSVIRPDVTAVLCPRALIRDPDKAIATMRGDLVHDQPRKHFHYRIFAIYELIAEAWRILAIRGQNGPISVATLANDLSDYCERWGLRKPSDHTLKTTASHVLRQFRTKQLDDCVLVNTSTDKVAPVTQ